MGPITHVAIRYKGKVYSEPAPSRHHDLIRQIYSEHREQIIGDEQGFLDADGEFLDRRQAKVRAKEHNQLLPRASYLDDCFSEDLW